MDPEVIAQLEEQLRELTELLARQNSMMGDQINAMNRMGSSAKSAADATNKNTNTSNQATTKYAEAQAKASTETEKSAVASKALSAGLGTLTASVGAAAGVFGSLTSSLLSAEQGLAKYGKVADAAAGAAEGIVKSIPLVGDALGGLVGVAGKIAAQLLTDGLKLVDTFVNVRDGITQVGGVLPVTGEQLIKLANNAGYYGERMQILGKITQGLGTSLAGLSTTAGQGATKFMEMAAVTEDTRRMFGRLGIDAQRLTEMQGMYVKSQIMSGNANELQAKTSAQLRKESLAYIENMTKLSALTGKQADQIQAEQETALSEYEELVKQRQENARIAELKRDGSKEALAEAEAIKKEQQNRVDYIKEAAALYGAKEAAQLGRMARTGTYDKFTGGMATLGVDAAKLQSDLKNAASGADVFAKSYDEINQKTGAMAKDAGDALQFIGEEGGNRLGLARGFLEANRKYGDKSLEDAKKQADKEIEEAKTRKDDIAEAVETVRSAERQFQAAYQEFLLDKVTKLSAMLKDIDLFSMVTKNLTSILTGLGVAIAGITALSAGMGIAGAMLAGKAIRGILGGGAGAAGTGAAGAAARGGAGFLGRAAPVISGAMVGKDAYDWATAEGPAKKEDVYGTIGGGIGALIGGGIGFFAGGVGAVPGAAIGAGIGNMIGNWWGGREDEKAAAGAGMYTPEQQAAMDKIAREQQAAMNLTGTGQIMGPEQLSALGIDSEALESHLSAQDQAKRDQAELLERQHDAANDLIGSSGSLDTTLEATNKSLKMFRDTIDQLNVLLGGPDKNNNGAAPPPPGGGMQFGGDTDKILATIRQMESGNNYSAQNPSSSASGAYQFIDSTWQSLTKKAGIGTEYKSAKDAPAAIQDQIAQLYLADIQSKAGGDLSKVPTAWFTGNVAGKSSAVSPQQVQAYVQKWMGIYGSMPGASGAPAGNNLYANLSRFNQGLATGAQGMGVGSNPAIALALAQSLTGAKGGSAQVQAFLKAGGVGLNSGLEAWCAAYVNAALQQAGLPGSGSAVANSFQNWGSGIPFNKVAPGDVVLETRNKPPNTPGGHVGLATGLFTGNKIRMVAGNTGNTVKEYDIPADGDVMVRRAPGLPMAERGGILSGPNTGYPAMLHGTEMVIPLNNARNNSSQAASLLAKVMGMAGERTASVGKYGNIQQQLMQVVNSETTKAIKAINENNSPLQNMSFEISTSIRKVMEAHNKTMHELSYNLTEMIDALKQSNDTTKKILKKAST